MGGERGQEGKGDELEYGVSRTGRGSAKVQIGAKLLCKGAKVRGNVSGGGWREETVFGSRVSVDQVSGSGPSGAGTGTGPEPVPEPEHLNQTPDGRDLGPENGAAAAMS